MVYSLEELWRDDKLAMNLLNMLIEKQADIFGYTRSEAVESLKRSLDCVGSIDDRFRHEYFVEVKMERK